MTTSTLADERHAALDIVAKQTIRLTKPSPLRHPSYAAQQARIGSSSPKHTESIIPAIHSERIFAPVSPSSSEWAIQRNRKIPRFHGAGRSTLHSPSLLCLTAVRDGSSLKKLYKN
jgi:hypothetical protein